MKHSIEVDEDVFEALQDLATPLVDTPNSVLRRLLLDGLAVREIGGSTASLASPRYRYAAAPADIAIPGPYASLGDERRAERGMSPRRFGKLLCAREFPGEMFERARRDRGAFRTMFESDERLLYFLNFNKPGQTNLWFKANATALLALREAEKPAHVVFANPAERVAWMIPVDELASKYAAVMGRRLGDGDADLNLDVKGDRLRELDWNIAPWRREVEG
jgi:hypothetical protein